MISFKQFIKESKIYSIDATGNKKLSNIDKINFHHSSLQKSLGYNNVVKVSDKFHDAYKKSGKYISSTGKKDEFSNKNVRNLIANGMNVEYPAVSVDLSGQINFLDGAHRYGFMHRLKLEKLVVMDKQSYEHAKKYNFINEY